MSRRGHAAKRRVMFVDTDDSPEKNSFSPEEETEDHRPQTEQEQQ